MDAHTNSIAGHPAPEGDALLAAVAGYRAGIAAYNSQLRPVDDPAAESLYRPSLKSLQNWTEPALSRRAALAALRLATDDLADGADIDLVQAMVCAALGYFESESSARLALIDEIHDLKRLASITETVVTATLDRRLADGGDDYLNFRLLPDQLDDVEFLAYELRARSEAIAGRAIGMLE